MNEILTWGLPLFCALALYGLCYNTLQTASHGTDYWMARMWFALATLVCLARLLFWGSTAHRPIGLRAAVCFVIVAGLVAITVASFKSISAKQQALKASDTVASKRTDERKGAAETIKSLSAFAEEGNKLIVRNKERARDVEWPQAEEWARRAETYLNNNVSEEQAAYFSLATTKPYPGLAVDRRFVDWVQTRVDRLGEIASETRSGKLLPTSNYHDKQQNSDTVQLVDQLVAFRDEGNEILRRFSIDRTPSPYTEQFDDWKTRVQAYLDKASTGYAHRFRSKTVEYQYPQSASARTRTIANDMYTRIMRLEEFIKERTR